MTTKAQDQPGEAALKLLEADHRALLAQVDEAALNANGVSGQLKLNEVLGDLAQRDQGVEILRRSLKVRAEPMLYRPDGDHSFFGDLARRKLDGAAQVRLQYHARQVAEAGAAESRDVGTGALGFPVPLWLLEKFAGDERRGRALSRLATTAPLPPGGVTLHVPRFDSGVPMAVQVENAAVTLTDATMTDLSSAVATITGGQVISRQLLERALGPAMDVVVYGDLLAAYDAVLEDELLNGSGTAGHLLGVRNVSGGTTTAYTDATPTFAEFLAKVGATAAAVATARKRLPEILLVHPRRWYWVASAVDTSGAPVVAATPVPSPRPDGACGNMAGLDTWAVDSVPVNLGAGTNEDMAFVLRPSDYVLLEGPPNFRVEEERSSGTLGVLVRLYRYVAFEARRYPTGTGTVGGSGLVTPTFP